MKMLTHAKIYSFYQDESVLVGKCCMFLGNVSALHKYTKER
jgi:hypothetical protein